MFFFFTVTNCECKEQMTRSRGYLYYRGKKSDNGCTDGNKRKGEKRGIKQCVGWLGELSSELYLSYRTPSQSGFGGDD